MIVADTNLLAQLVIESEGTPAAEAVFRRDPDWIAPILWRFEMQNLLLTRLRVLGAAPDDCLAAYEKADQLVRTVPDAVGFDPVIDVAIETSLSGYDAEFVALARTLGLRLVTFDRRILRAAPTIATAPEEFV